MDLLDVINSIIQTNTDAQKLTDIIIGTVVEVGPLQVQISPTLILPEEVLILCDSVKQLTDSVEISASFKSDLEDAGITISDDVIGKVLGVQTLEVGDQVEISDSFKSALQGAGVTLSSDIIGTVKREYNLEVGDKLIMLRVLKGQQFIVLSKV